MGNRVITRQAKHQFSIVVKGTIGGCTIYAIYSQVIGPYVITNALTNVIILNIMNIWVNRFYGWSNAKPMLKEINEINITVRPRSIRYLLPNLRSKRVPHRPANIFSPFIISGIYAFNWGATISARWWPKITTTLMPDSWWNVCKIKANTLANFISGGYYLT